MVRISKQTYQSHLLYSVLHQSSHPTQYTAFITHALQSQGYTNWKLDTTVLYTRMKEKQIVLLKSVCSTFKALNMIKVQHRGASLSYCATQVCSLV